MNVRYSWSRLVWVFGLIGLIVAYLLIYLGTGGDLGDGNFFEKHFNFLVLYYLGAVLSVHLFIWIRAKERFRQDPESHFWHYGIFSPLVGLLLVSGLFLVFAPFVVLAGLYTFFLSCGLPWALSFAAAYYARQWGRQHTPPSTTLKRCNINWDA